MSQADSSTLQIPRIPPQRPGRPAWPGMAVAVAAVLVASALALLVMTNAGDGTDGGSRVLSAATPTTAVPPTTQAIQATQATPQTTPKATTATTPAPATPATTVPAKPEALSADSRVSLDGIGPIDIGMTYEQAAKAAGIPLHLKVPEPGSTCQYAGPIGGPSDEVGFMLVDGRIARVDVGRMGPDRVKTVSGIGKGSTEADVMRAYPGRITVRPHPYVETGRYLVYTPVDPSLSHLSLIFETNDGEVRAYRAGLKEQVSWVEGCG